MNDVFIEALRITSFSSAKKGKHYNKGFGFVTTKKNQQDKSTRAHKSTLTREYHDRLIKNLKTRYVDIRSVLERPMVQTVTNDTIVIR